MARRYDVLPACYRILNATRFMPLFLPPGTHVLSFGVRRIPPLVGNPVVDHSNDPETWLGLKSTAVDIFPSDSDWSHGPKGYNSALLDPCCTNERLLATCHGDGQLDMAAVSFNTEDFYGQKRRSDQHGELAFCTGRVAAWWVNPQEDALSMAAQVAVW